MKQTSNFNIKFLAAWLNISGIALPAQKHAKYVKILKYYLVYAFILMTSAQVVLFRRASTLVEMSTAMVFFNSGLFLNSTTLIVHLKKKFIINIIQSMKVDFIQPFTVFSIVPTNQKFKKFFFNTGLPGVCLYVFATSGTVLLFPFSDKSYDDINALFIPGAFPWTIDSMVKYLLTLALEFSWLSVLSAPVFLNFMFGFYYIFEIQIQYEILCKMVENFNNSNEWISMTGSVDEVREHKMIQSFNYCIRHHQNIVKFV